MLKQFIPKLIQELELDESAFNGETPGSFVIPLEDEISISINEMGNGFVIKCLIAPFPLVKQELFASEMMLANLFGQGTCGSTLGLNSEGTTIILTRHIDYTLDYKSFKAIIEDFINMTDLWREEALSKT